MKVLNRSTLHGSDHAMTLLLVLRGTSIFADDLPCCARLTRGAKNCLDERTFDRNLACLILFSPLQGGLRFHFPHRLLHHPHLVFNVYYSFDNLHVHHALDSD